MSSSSISLSSSSAASNNTRGIHLLRQNQERYIVGVIDGFRFTVYAYGAYGLNNEIFRYLRHPYDPTTGADVDEFDGVCSSVDLEELPVNEPRADGSSSFFRLSSLDLVFRSRELADQTWEAIKEDVSSLIRSLNVMDDLSGSETVTIGNPPDAAPPV